LEDDDWNNVGSYQLVPGEVKDFHKRKSLEAQRLERIQQQLDDQFQQAAKEFGLPMDLLQNGGKKQKAVEENNVTTADKHYQEKKQKKRHETQSPNSKNNNGEGGGMVQLHNEAVEENTTKHQENNTSDEDSNDESKESTDESVNSVNTEQMNFKRMIDRCTVERKGIEKAASDGQKKKQ